MSLLDNDPTTHAWYIVRVEKQNPLSYSFTEYRWLSNIDALNWSQQYWSDPLAPVQTRGDLFQYDYGTRSWHEVQGFQ